MPLKDVEARRAYDRKRPQRKINKERRNMFSYFRHLWQAYKLTKEDFRILLTIQDCRCAICNQIKPLHVDHCHQTGKIRLLLCAGCNHVVGILETKPDIVKEAQKYVDYYNGIKQTQNV